MVEDGSVTDDEILSGFKRLQEAMAIGFERQSAELRSVIRSEVRSEVRSEIRSGIALVRADISALEHRMFRRFDAVDERADRVDGRLARIENHLGPSEA